MGGLLPVANGLFVQALPDAFRARAFGVVQGGLQLLQGAAVLLTGLLVQVAAPGCRCWSGCGALPGCVLVGRARRRLAVDQRRSPRRGSAGEDAAATAADSARGLAAGAAGSAVVSSGSVRVLPAAGPGRRVARPGTMES